ncbi:ATP-binding protein [Paraburkholderia sp. UCT31]|uniref:DUF5710 domain-containing protein n=1 Tax=Paraburkholderia sp. UCT31 TaxID=2615209 RepID=UPI00165562B8|nr:DUF5710 domain-containing protein [Paraburkholderia sp. UCT31]MBC8737067.1 ATP-binding protein [Paraburkholderia sp. UCT31]
MKIPLGKDYFEAKNGRLSKVVMDTSQLYNAHALLLGMSGVGKSHTFRSMIARADTEGQPVRFLVYDVHGDIDVPDASEVLFSEQTPWGLNPLRVNPDVHFGGVNKCIRNFIRTVNQASVTSLGSKQEAVLRKLLLDVFAEHGFDPDDSRTWGMNEYDSRLISAGADNRLYLEVPFAEKDEASKNGARWDGARKLWYTTPDKYKGELTRWKPAYKPRTYPTVADVLAYADRIFEERYLGSDQKAVRALNQVYKTAQARQKKLLESIKMQRYEGMQAELAEDLEEAKANAIEAFTAYVNGVTTGREFEMIRNYNSPEVLKSVVERLENLQASGLFKSMPPPFDESKRVWRYNLKALNSEDKKMMVFFLLQEQFYAAVQAGQTDKVRTVVVLDELGVYVSANDNDGGDGIIGVIAREARKFGLALWAANQSPKNVPESLISSVATKIVLGIDEGHWDSAVTKLNIERKLLDWIRGKQTMAVQMKVAGATKNRWWWVELLKD